VNFGEFWMVQDRLFGTFFAQASEVRDGDVELQDRTFPRSYWGQLRWLFAKRDRDRRTRR